MPRAVRMNPRKHKAAEKKVDRNCRKGRIYDDYLAYMAANSDEAVLEGDTVEGKNCILTLTWVQWSFQAGFLRDHNNSASVTLVVNQLYETLGFEMFHKVFPSVWLIDRNTSVVLRFFLLTQGFHDDIFLISKKETILWKKRSIQTKNSVCLFCLPSSL
jgi:hypothetical protein